MSKVRPLSPCATIDFMKNERAPKPTPPDAKEKSLADQFAEEMARQGHRVVVTEYDDEQGTAVQREYISTPPTPPSTSS